MSESALQSDRLSELQAACRKLRAKNQRPRYSRVIKDGLLTLLDQGYSYRQIHQATGVSEPALRDWAAGENLKKTKQPEVRILPVTVPSDQLQDRHPLMWFKIDNVEVKIYSREG
jgi:hypothetical protein